MTEATTIPDDDQLQALLAQLLVPVRRARQTPLQFDINSAGIVAAALASQRAQGELSSDPDWPAVIRGLDNLVTRALLPESEPEDALAAVPPRREGGQATHPADLAAWLETLFETTRNIDAEALEILALRLEGMENRNITERLGTGLRLVRRILSALRDARQREAENPSQHAGLSH